MRILAATGDPDLNAVLSEELARLGFAAAGECWSAGELLAAAERGAADAVVLSSKLPGVEDPAELLARLRATGVRAVFLAGRRGDAEAEVLAERLVASGFRGVVWDGARVEEIAERLAGDEPCAGAGVEPDEREAAELLAEGGREKERKGGLFRLWRGRAEEKSKPEVSASGPDDEVVSEVHRERAGSSARPSTPERASGARAETRGGFEFVHATGEGRLSRERRFERGGSAPVPGAVGKRGVSALRVVVVSPWIPGGSSCLAAALARELARAGNPAFCVDCDLRGRGLGVRLGLSPAELWEWDWRSVEEPAELKDGTVLWALDPYRRAPDGEELAGELERIVSGMHKPAVLDAGTDPDSWWFRLALRHADALVWTVRADPLLLARALACWRGREAAGVPELLALWGEGSPEEASALFGLECVQVEGPEDRRGLRELLSALERVPARGAPVVLFVGFRRAPALDGFEAVCFRTGYEAAGWLEGSVPAAVVLSGDMPDLVPFLRALREDPRLARAPVGVAGGGPEALEAGADDVLFEVSAEAVELLLAKGRRLREAREEAETDPLTGLPNRRAGERMLEALARRCRERGEHLSVALLDLDDFKKVNDAHGHPAGDAVLKAFGEFLKASLRSSDLACRWGGEEFLLAFPNTPVSGAVRACENLLGKWRAKSVSHGGAVLSCTFSAGVAPCPGFPADVAAEANRALLRAKAEGKGRVVAAGRAEAARAG